MKNLSPHFTNKRVIQAALFFVLIFGLMSSNAQNPVTPAQAFNVFLKNDATLITNETEGPVALGGNLILPGDYRVSTNNAGTFKVSGVTVSLVVGGKLTYNSGSSTFYVNSNGYIKIGDCTGSTIWYTDNNGANSPLRVTNGSYSSYPQISLQISAQQLGVSAVNNPVCQGGLIDFATAFTTMKSSSTGISGLTDNAALTNSNGNSIAHTGLPSQVKLTLNSGNNILNLTGTDMNNVQNFTFNNQPDASHILIINVNAPGTFNWSVWNSGGIGGTNCPYILYNFYNTTTLNIQGNGSVEGTVFAPYAAITKTVNQANIEGQVIAQSYYQSGGENHYFPFNGNVPVVTNCTGFKTYTQGGWGADAHGDNPGVYLKNNFPTVFPNGLTIGCGSNTLHLTTFQDVSDFLPSGGTPSVLPAGTKLNPGQNYSNTFAAQLVAATLNVIFDQNDAAFGSNSIHLGDLYIQSAPFAGQTISQLLSIANNVIGGCSTSYTVSDLNTALDNFNNNYDNGTSDDGFLVCTSPVSCTISVDGTSSDATCHGSSTGAINVTASGALGNVTYSWNDGVTSEDRSNLAAGTYTVTATDGGCTSSKTFTIHEPSSVEANGSVTNVSITNGSNGSVDVTATGGTTPYTYLWNDGVTSEDRSNLTATTYTVTVTDHNGCSAQKTFTVEQPSCHISMDGTPTDATCHGSSTGSIDVTVSGAQGNVTYSWNDGVTSEDRSNLTAGTYTLTVTDEGNCSTDKSFTIHEPSAVEANGSVTNVTINNGSNGSVDVTATGGTTPYTYLWNDGVTTEDRNNLIAGTYTVTVTDHHGCSADKTFTVEQPSCVCEAPTTFTVDSISSTQANVCWNPINCATAYLLKWRTEPKKKWLYRTIQAPSTCTIFTNKYPDVYDIQVATICSNGDTTAYSDMYIYQTFPSCLPPAGLNADDIQSKQATLHWTATGDAVTYTVSYAVVGSNSFKNKSASTNSVIIKKLLPSTQYQWKVKSNCGAGNYTLSGTYSGLESFTTASQRLLDEGSDVINGSMSVYPNPATTNFAVSFNTGSDVDDDYTLVIYNMFGQSVFAEEGKLDAGKLLSNISLNEMTGGVYSVNMMVRGQRFTQKIIVTKD